MTSRRLSPRHKGTKNTKEEFHHGEHGGEKRELLFEI
jgi:hypothetical protein